MPCACEEWLSTGLVTQATDEYMLLLYIILYKNIIKPTGINSSLLVIPEQCVYKVIFES